MRKKQRNNALVTNKFYVTERMKSGKGHYMSETNNEGFKPIETQEELNSIIKERLKRERESTEKRFEGWVSPEDHAKAIEEANKAFDDFKKLHEGDEQTIKDLTAKNREYETANLKSRIAHEVGLSYEWISRIGGDDESSIRADAESLKKLVGSSSKPIPTKSTETATPNAHDASVKTVLNSIKNL